MTTFLAISGALFWLAILFAGGRFIYRQFRRKE